MKGRLAQLFQSSPLGTLSRAPKGGFIQMDGEEYYRISAYPHLDPFMMSIASDSDLWMFITSMGGLTAGRVDAEKSVFPYLTVDQLHNAHNHTGPLTVIRIEQENLADTLWEPFSPATSENKEIERNLYKNVTGNRIVFEEINHAFGLAFKYSWAGSDAFGWVRTATVENRTSVKIQTSILDGLRNILPYGAPLSLYQQSSNLVNAYKKNEVDPETGLGIFSLTAGITDRTDALEVLRANTVWCCGLEEFRTHLSLDCINAFIHGRVLPEENVLNGTSGNYMVSFSLDLEPEEYSQWQMVAGIGQDHLQIASLRRELLDDGTMFQRIGKSLSLATENLRRNVCCADGLQVSGNPMQANHHFANVLFNNMRGGIFAHNYDLPASDFADFMQVRNQTVAQRHADFINQLPETISIQKLRLEIKKTGDPSFERLCYEYLPLYFGRRHGDPSRPWNKFSIHVRTQDGQQALNYQGNWRDIFQNWEALCTAFPSFLPSIIAKFVNASTVDGFNPYRITRDGVDWEAPNNENPWSNIGYWGDHQIIYLLKLLEAMHQHEPHTLPRLLGRELFSYAEVPYAIKPYAEILANPKDSIDFDTKRAATIARRVSQRGMDGKLLTDDSGSVYQVNFMEKLLVPALAKLSNMIPDAGIWMNTQRPEWNDANNALGGGGVSVVTLCYLRRYLVFLSEILEKEHPISLSISTEVATWFTQIGNILESEQQFLTGNTLLPRKRKKLQDALGLAYSQYRETVYADGFSGKTNVSTDAVASLFRTALDYVEWGIRANRRHDGLYHAYNLLDYSKDGSEVSVSHLQEMLEGQVAVLSSGLLGPEEALDILEGLYKSAIFRPEENSFMLYPAKELPGFLDKNHVPAEKVEAIPLLAALLATNEKSIIAFDVEGTCRFNGSFQNAEDLTTALDKLQEVDAWSDGVTCDRAAVLHLFEEVFQHVSYTGRSGVMYGYEGLGCIYWHMVAKLLLAVQEITLQAHQESRPQELQQALADMYFRIRSGLGYEKSVTAYGAFPADPYSHTPPSGSVKQPGMTGQVKEEILTRRGELGITIKDGVLGFEPILLQSDEFSKQPGDFNYFDLQGNAQSIALPTRSLAFTICQIPVIYVKVTGEPGILVDFNDGSTAKYSGNKLDAPLSKDLFRRTGSISRILVEMP